MENYVKIALVLSWECPACGKKEALELDVPNGQLIRAIPLDLDVTVECECGEQRQIKQARWGV